MELAEATVAQTPTPTATAIATGWSMQLAAVALALKGEREREQAGKQADRQAAPLVLISSPTSHWGGTIKASTRRK